MVTGRPAELLKTLAEHDDVDAIWSFTDEASVAAAKTLSIGNLKQVFSNEGRAIDWFDRKQGEGRWFLDHAVQVKKDRKSTRLNSSHGYISYAVFCLKKK